MNVHSPVAVTVCTHLLTDFLSYGSESGCSVHVFAVHHLRDVHQYRGLPEDELVQNVLL